MNILMFTNYAPMDIQLKNNNVLVNEGWVHGLQQNLLLNDDVVLHIMYPQEISTEPIMDVVNDRFYAYGYYHISKVHNDENNIKKQIGRYCYINDIDVVHIMGTEFFHSLAAFRSVKDLGLGKRTVVSVQGIVSLCARHYDYGVPRKYCHGLTLQEFYNGFSSITKRAKDFKRRGTFEIQLIQECENVIGRTDWDRSCTKLINPGIHYYYNGENLRPAFYNRDAWNIDNCDKFSIFISQATYSLKGLHHVLKVMPEIVKRFPETVLYVGGKSPINDCSWKRNSYANYLVSLIKRGKLEKHIVFCGVLTENQMKERYLKSHIFLSPSNIENSSNSIGEAMILGTPIIASNVGGTNSIVENNINGFLYPLNEPYIMLQKVVELFENDDLCKRISQNERIHSLKLYDPSKNIGELLDIYKAISEKYL